LRSLLHMAPGEDKTVGSAVETETTGIVDRIRRCTMFRILALDGGGIKGAFTAAVLE